MALPPSRSSTIAWRFSAGRFSSVRVVRSASLDSYERAKRNSSSSTSSSVPSARAISNRARAYPSMQCVAHELAPVLAPTRWMKPSISCLVGGVVERLVDDALDGDARVAGDLGRAVRRWSAPGRPAMSASARASSSAISASMRTRPSAISASACASASAWSRSRSDSMLPCARRMLDRLGLGRDLRRGRIVEFLLDAGGAIVEALLDRRARRTSTADRRRSATPTDAMTSSFVGARIGFSVW